MAIKINGISADLLSKINGLDIASGAAPSFDADAQAFITAAGITDSTWNLQTPVTSPDNITKPLVEWLIEIDYEPKTIEDL